MKTVIARRPTTCTFCGDIILPGSYRLSDIRKYTDSEGRWHTDRKHFHFQKEGQEGSCFELYAAKAFGRMDISPLASNNSRGRPRKFGHLTPEQRHLRLKVLRRMRNTIYYYIHDGHLDLITPKPLLEISAKDVSKAHRFRIKLEGYLKELEVLGGIPLKFKEIQQSLASEVNAIADVWGPDYRASVSEAIKEVEK